MKKATIQMSINTQNAIKSMGDLNNELNGTISTVGDLKMTVEALTAELESTEFGTERFKELKGALIDANTQLKNYELSIEALDNEQLASELKSVAGGFMDIVGGLTLIGVSGENMEKVVQTFAKVEGVTKGISGAIELYSSGMKVANTLIVKAGAAHAAMAAAQTASAGSTIASSVAMKVLNAVMNANPVVLLVTGVGLLVGALALFSMSSETAAEKQKALNESQEKANGIMEANNRKIDERIALEKELAAIQTGGLIDQENQIKLLEAQGASMQQIFEARKDLTLNKLTELQNAEFNSGRIFNEKEKAANLKEIKDTQTELQILQYQFTNETKAADEKAAADRRASNDKRNAESLKRIQDYNNSITAYYDAIEADRQANITDSREKELQSEANKYDSFVELADAAGQSTVTITINYQERIKEINAKYDKEAIDSKKKLEIETRILNEETAMYDELLTVKTEEEKEKIRIKYNNSLINLRIQQIKIARDIELSNVKLTEQERIKIIAQSENEIAKLRGEATETTVAKTKATWGSFIDDFKKRWNESLVETLSSVVDNVANIAYQITNLLNQAFTESANRATYERVNRFNTETESYNAMLANQTISREEFDARISEMNQRKEQEELQARRKSFKQNKALNIVNAVMGTAQAVMQALGSFPPPLSFVMAAINGALGAAQVGIISSQQFTAARGGVVPGNGSKVDTVPAKLASGEMVINAQSAQMFPRLLSDINQAGGGISLAPELPMQSQSQGSTVFSKNESKDTRVYVLESDITKTQNRVTRIEQASSF